MFLAALERVTKETDELRQEVAEQESKLWDALRKERKLLKTEIVLLRDVLEAWEGAAGERRLRDALGEMRKGWCLQFQKL